MKLVDTMDVITVSCLALQEYFQREGNSVLLFTVNANEVMVIVMNYGLGRTSYNSEDNFNGEISLLSSSHFSPSHLVHSFIGSCSIMMILFIQYCRRKTCKNLTHFFLNRLSPSTPCCCCCCCPLLLLLTCLRGIHESGKKTRIMNNAAEHQLEEASSKRINFNFLRIYIYRC